MGILILCMTEEETKVLIDEFHKGVLGGVMHVEQRPTNF